ncbi:OsmC family protein [Aquisalimonas lutea]|uniref:OsmC family protein n=1 Tax=Aquisalimonas lutea TaxID=1327750 RepID=UPI0025B4E102|nr:OsmC family protein [Aquisalimonas lutea]MDN3519764.1 OsmC family protein [Aquisalimonas lutea]
MKRNAAAVWKGGLKNGGGEVSTESGVLSAAQYAFGTRFENGTGTNPEELLAAAHAGCYSMALSLVLGESDITPERIDTTASVNIEPSDDGFTITTVHLDVYGDVPGINADDFQKAAEQAKAGCPVSKLFNAEITMTAHLKRS